MILRLSYKFIFKLLRKLIKEKKTKYFMKEIGSGKIVVKNSKFYSYFLEINSIEEIAEIIEELSLKHKKAKHICYAAKYFEEEIIKNDSEVGSPGKVLLQELISNKFNKNLLVVCRIFGGTKLGVGNVSRSFRLAAREAIKNSQ